jgi:putative oxidoreductase
MTSLTADRYDNLSSSTFSRITHALLATDQSTLLTVLRIALGVVILPHGLQKTVGWFGGYGFGATMDAFVSGGIPAFFAFLAIAAESAGAIGLITGFTTRIAAFGIGVTMLVASQMHKVNGFFMNWTGQQKGEGIEFHILAIGVAIALMIGGAGRFSLDRLLSKNAK